MTETEAQLRARVAELEAQLAAQPVIPALPAEHAGEAIEWRPWEEAPFIIAHVDNGCDKCGHPGLSMLTFGVAGPGKPLIRFQAHRCPACQEMTVYRRDRDWRGLDLVEIAYSAPRTVVRTDGGEA